MDKENSENNSPWRFSSVRVLVVDEGSLVSVVIFKSVLNLLLEHSNLSKLIILGKLKYCWNSNCLVHSIVVKWRFIQFTALISISYSWEGVRQSPYQSCTEFNLTTLFSSLGGSSFWPGNWQARI